MAADDEQLMTLDVPEGQGPPIDAALVLSLEDPNLPDPPADSELLEDEGED